MKVIVDRTKCTGLGVCESLAPYFFEVNESGELELLKEDVAADELATVEEAIASCPTAALHIER
ncbi:ferredoxin [Rhodococcus chondri]|uniref:Ferredoxin n=1 Tax=Rhodococcus chondri TaxID=3065941 RepID=A0ABU7JT54_9NOCA|nr:ferredoxin [Rhodococcus sp. CC-R104]MEE2033025.1 ferredoxin [Rhodococcus sp. CC-R104]